MSGLLFIVTIPTENTEENFQSKWNECCRRNFANVHQSVRKKFVNSDCESFRNVLKVKCTIRSLFSCI